MWRNEVTQECISQRAWLIIIGTLDLISVSAPYPAVCLTTGMLVYVPTYPNVDILDALGEKSVCRG